MKTPSRRLGLCLFGIATALLTANWQLQAQDEEKFLLPNVIHHFSGRAFYQAIKLKDYTLTASESKNSLSVSTSFVNYTLEKDEKNHLASFRLHLGTAPVEGFRDGGAGRQAMIPVSNSTLYGDLDGDTVLDTMVKTGPQLHESYILYKNSWIQVNNNMRGFAIGRGVSTQQSKEAYIFKKNEWERVK